ncbi:MAG: hypothetical protein JWO03_2165 [Bacteroidetes bacterium]|nr:hypothetical protein [Bacteroidota bacterium]
MISMYQPYHLCIKIKIMKKNVGAVDGVIRLILSFVIFSFAILHGPWWIAFLAIIPIATATLFYCPLYDIAGFSTCDKGEEKA